MEFQTVCVVLLYVVVLIISTVVVEPRGRRRKKEDSEVVSQSEGSSRGEKSTNRNSSAKHIGVYDSAKIKYFSPFSRISTEKFPMYVLLRIL